MPISVDVMRMLLLLCLLGLSLLAILYLRKRKMSFAAYLGWGILAILLPLLGPFLVIFYKPGKPRAS
jgi:hypothetical protein